jgi:hypothetical protein
MELDIFVPSLSLAFEYQGKYHYETNWQFGDSQRVQRRDKEKIQACQSFGITLIVVSYKWKHDTQSIVDMIRHVRPDIIPEHIPS